MMLKRVIARTVSELSALRFGASSYRSGFRILFYHSIGSRIAGDSYGMSVKPRLFAEHMAILANTEGLRLVGMIEGQQQGKAPLRVAVSFDDGYKDNFYVAAPILLRHHIPFTVFVTSAFARKPSDIFMNARELRELSALPGVTIGSHGATHIALDACDEPTLWKELADSKNELEDIIGKPVTVISYPYGFVNRTVIEAVKKIGYAVGACSRFDINDATRNPLLLCRTEIVAADSERVFVQKLRGAWDWYRWRARDPVSL